MGGVYQRFDTSKWRGLNEDENPSTLKPGELTIAENVWRAGRRIGTRPGTGYEESGKDWDATIDGAGAGSPCQGLYDASNNYDGTRKLIGIFNGNVYEGHVTVTDLRDKTTNSVVISTGKDNLWSFAMHKGLVYAVGGATAGPDSMWSWDLNSANPLIKVTFQTALAADQYGEYIFEKWNQLWVNGFRGTTVENNPMVGRYCALNDGTSWPVANTIGGTSAIGGFPSFGDQFSTGWGSYRDNRGDFLLFLTNKAIYSIVETGNPYTPVRVNDVIPTGCASQRCFVDLGVDSGDAVYISEKGIHSLRQSQIHGRRADRFLSWKIRNTFSTINKNRLKYATGAYLVDEGVVIFAVPTGSSITNDLILILDIRDSDEREGMTADNAVWYTARMVGGTTTNPHQPAILITARDRTTDDPYVYGGNYKGDVFRFNTSDYRDLTAAYPVHVRTRHDDFGAPGITKVVGNAEVWVEANDDYEILMNWIFNLGKRAAAPRTLPLTTQGLTLPFRLDDTAILGSETNQQRKVVYGTGHGETVAHEFQHGGGNQPFWISRVIQQIAGLGDDIGDTA
jgi:hypothetical protein